MAGPTPVSALIHAATMVTAGIFMITRLNYLFDLAPDVQNIIAIIERLLVATIALVQTDIKVLASTVLN
jgi:NADH-quinone oxidoreductase subunit L